MSNALRIRIARQMVKHCHKRAEEWRAAREVSGFKAEALAHYAAHKARYLAELQTLIGTGA